VEGRWALGALDTDDMRFEAWRLTLLACGYADVSAARDASQIHRRCIGETYRLFDDAPALLSSAKAAGLSLALVTNAASDTQRDKLRALALEDAFDAVVISAEVGVAKPDERVFQLALRSLGVEPQDAWHVGDNLATDVAGARSAGLTAVWLNRNGLSRGEHDPRPDVEVGSLRELHSMLFT
jgi:putative hydrolase of the HAD superfamily